MTRQPDSTSAPARPARRRTDWRARLLRGLLLTLSLVCMMLADATVQADGYDDRRARAGARLFRSLLAADIALETKAATDGALHVVVLGGDPHFAEELTGLIAPADNATSPRIRNLPLRIDAHSEFPTGEADAPRIVGIFLATPLPAPELDRLIRWSISHRVILYSPFEGDVERGATAGISIEAKVQPYLNAATLQASGLELKPFFVKVAKVHQ